MKEYRNDAYTRASLISRYSVVSDVRRYTQVQTYQEDQSRCRRPQCRFQEQTGVSNGVETMARCHCVSLLRQRRHVCKTARRHVGDDLLNTYRLAVVSGARIPKLRIHIHSVEKLGEARKHLRLVGPDWRGAALVRKASDSANLETYRESCHRQIGYAENSVQILAA